MNIQKALENFLQLKPVIVDGLTFNPSTVDELKLDSGDLIYWIYTENDRWISIDADSEEVILFHKIDDTIDQISETIVYNGRDYEFTLEEHAVSIEDGEDTDKIKFMDYETSTGEILRIAENLVTNEVVFSIGEKIVEEQLQNA